MLKNTKIYLQLSLLFCLALIVPLTYAQTPQTLKAALKTHQTGNIYYYQNQDPNAAIQVNMALTPGKPLSLFNYQLIIVSFQVTDQHNHCTVTDHNNRKGVIATFSVNYLPYYWSGQYGQISGMLLSPVSFIHWDTLRSPSGCHIPAATVSILPKAPELA